MKRNYFSKELEKHISQSSSFRLRPPPYRAPLISALGVMRLVWMMWVKLVWGTALMLVAGCTYGPVEEWARIENEVVRPDTLQFAPAVRASTGPVCSSLLRNPTAERWR